MNKIIKILVVTFFVVVTVGHMTTAYGASKGQFEADIWVKVFEISSKITGDSKTVRKYLSIGQKDKNIREEDSEFNKRASEKFGNNYIEWMDQDLEDESIPGAVFKTVMAGSGYMGYFDWKNIYDSEELIFTIDNVLAIHSIDKLTKEERAALKTAEDKDDLDFIARTNVMVLEKAVEHRGYRILWFDEDSDSYAFFIVSPDVYESLLTERFDEYHKFKQLRF